MWKIEHANGRREIDELHLPLGQPVRLVLSTEDVIHSFFVPAFRIKQDAVPGRYTTIAFTPTREGEYRLHCAEYCGTDHARMGGSVVVMAPAAFAQWLRARQREPVARRAGLRALPAARAAAAATCNSTRARARPRRHLRPHGPSAGRPTLVADEAYLRDSILLPKRDVVAGYEPIMPSFQGQLDEERALGARHLPQGKPETQRLHRYLGERATRCARG